MSTVWPHFRPYLVSVVVLHGITLEVKAVQELLVTAGQQHVKDMEVALASRLNHDTTLFQQIVDDLSAKWLTLWTKWNEQYEREVCEGGIVIVVTALTLKSNCTSMYLPKRDELSFRIVFALPNAVKSSINKPLT